MAQQKLADPTALFHYQSKIALAKSTPTLRDQVVLSSVLGNEHVELSVYESLIVPAEALGLTDAVALLQANLDQEVYTSDELRTRLQELVHA